MKQGYQKSPVQDSKVVDLTTRRGQRQAKQFFSDNSQALLPLVDLIETSQLALEEFVGVVTQAAIGAVLQLSAERIAGPPHQGRAQGTVRRYGTQAGRIALGTEQIAVTRPRLRQRGNGPGSEVAVPAYEAMRQDTALTQKMFATMLEGVSTRRYERVVPRLAEHCGVSKSQVSDKFVALSAQQLRELCERKLADLDVLVLYIDGVHAAGHAIIGVIGVDAQGAKHVLGLREGATENAVVVKELLQDLVRRGLDPERRRLFVIDGSKALRSGIESVFGAEQAVQRCRQHKLENVLGHLPEELRPQVRQVMQAAYKLEDAKAGLAKLQQQARWLEKEHPGAADSLREGLAETFTINALGLPAPLRRCLGTTNIIESSFSGVRDRSRRVTHWQNGDMILRWTAAGLLKTAHSFRKIMGHQYLWMLQAALQHDGIDAKIHSKAA